MLFLDILILSTLSTDIRVHRAGSQLKSQFRKPTSSPYPEMQKRTNGTNAASVKKSQLV